MARDPGALGVRGHQSGDQSEQCEGSAHRTDDAGRCAREASRPLRGVAHGRRKTTPQLRFPRFEPAGAPRAQIVREGPHPVDRVPTGRNLLGIRSFRMHVHS
ncbi:hypothetical protein NSERUTF1_3044 [Nocardia seriolae]|nr:hypothetical protein NSERUTF1_3044 [Nocardia seriolae]